MLYIKSRDNSLYTVFFCKAGTPRLADNELGGRVTIVPHFELIEIDLETWIIENKPGREN